MKEVLYLLYNRGSDWIDQIQASSKALEYPVTLRCTKFAVSYYRSVRWGLSAPVKITPLEMCASVSSCLKTLFSQTLPGKGYNFECT